MFYRKNKKRGKLKIFFLSEINLIDKKPTFSTLRDNRHKKTALSSGLYGGGSLIR